MNVGSLEDMLVLLMISTFGCVNGIVLAGARVFQTMAKDGLFLKSAIENNKNGVPEKSLWMQGIWSSLPAYRDWETKQFQIGRAHV